MMPKISPELIDLIRIRQTWGNFDGSIDWGLGQIPELCYASSTSLRRPAVLQRCGKRRQGHVSVQLAWYVGSRYATSYNTTAPQSWRDRAGSSFVQSCRGIIKTGHCTIYKHTVPSTLPKLFHYCFNASVHRHRHRNTSHIPGKQTARAGSQSGGHTDTLLYFLLRAGCLLPARGRHERAMICMLHVGQQ